MPDAAGRSWNAGMPRNARCGGERAPAPFPQSGNPTPVLRSMRQISWLGGSNVYRHGVGSVPFIPFPNNLLLKGDLHLMYKDLVDLYDRVSSGFANDIEDVQQIIYIITNYGGEDLGEFLNDLRRYKAIKVNNDGVSSGGGVSTLAIDIPVEARNSLLEPAAEGHHHLRPGSGP